MKGVWNGVECEFCDGGFEWFLFCHEDGDGQGVGHAVEERRGSDEEGPLLHLITEALLNVAHKEHTVGRILKHRGTEGQRRRAESEGQLRGAGTAGLGMECRGEEAVRADGSLEMRGQLLALGGARRLIAVGTAFTGRGAGTTHPTAEDGGGRKRSEPRGREDGRRRGERDGRTGERGATR